MSIREYFVSHHSRLSEAMKLTASISYPLLAVLSALSIILLLLGGWLTYAGLGAWYYELDFPPFQPPPWLFTPAWVIQGRSLKGVSSVSHGSVNLSRGTAYAPVLLLLSILTWQLPLPVARQRHHQPELEGA